MANSEIAGTRAIGPYPAEQHTNRVTYNTENPNGVWVVGSRGTGAFLQTLGPDLSSPGNGECVYQRQK